jgi:polyribonucleotide nucleotidyltransferase
MPKIFKLENSDIEVEIGKHARQATGAAWLRCGDNVLLSTAVVSKEEREYAGFFPLIVEYRERPVSVGKIPGGYIKREGRLTDNETLISRTIDRGIRPLFPKFYFNEVQVINSLLSSDGKFPNEVLGILGASIALTISGMPFLGPIGAAQVCKIDGEWQINGPVPTSDTKDRFVVVGTENGIAMVEGHCDNLSESKLLDLLSLAHVEIKKQVLWQLEIKKELGVESVEPKSDFDWNGWEAKVKNAMPTDWDTIIYGDKGSFGERLSAAKSDVLAKFAADVEAGVVKTKQLGFFFDLAFKAIAADVITKNNKRFDGREPGQIRPISCEIGFLPGAHGSSLFTRGETQALASITLGAAQDAQKVETLFGGVEERTFMLHYNFPPYSTGEIRMPRGVGRREIGHGHLAQSTFNSVLPSQEDFPYAIRSVVDILSSNGSSSMAAVCSTSLSLMDAGVPVKHPVAGIAMGLLQDSAGTYTVISDILGSEDAHGLMDFKITGNQDGILSFQMDIKARDGLSRDVLEKALDAARVGRIHILEEMSKVISNPRDDVAQNAPRVTTIRIEKDKIGALIGPGGKNIKEISSSTETTIDIADDGLVRIFSRSADGADKAKAMVQAVTGDIEAGTEYNGIVRSVVDFGLFVQVVPGKDGLVHVSSIARDKQSRLAELLPIGSSLKVIVTSNDKKTGRIRLVAPELE